MLDKILFFLLVIFQLSDDTNALQECYNGTQFGVCYDGWYCCGKHGYCCQRGFICRKSQCIQREPKCAYLTLVSLASFILLVIVIFFEIGRRGLITAPKTVLPSGVEKKSYSAETLLPEQTFTI